MIWRMVKKTKRVVKTVSDYKSKIVKFYKSKKRMPTFRELAHICDFVSPNSAYKLAEKLELDGFLYKDVSGKLLPKRIFGEARLLGLIEAGFPSAAEEELADTLSFDDYLIENKEASYILKVKGDSMIDVGIQEGDMVIVERGKEPKSGDIVVAEIDRAWTMKYFRKSGAKVWLEPANKKYKPIYPKEDLKIEAIVKAVVRKY